MRINMALLSPLLLLLLLHISAAEEVSIVVDTNHTQNAKNDIVTENAKYVVVNENEKNNVVAFSAELSTNAELSPGATIVFDRVYTNVGGQYFDTTGQFVCQNEEGLYVFVWNLAKYQVSGLTGMRCIGSLRSGGIDRKYGPKTSYYSTSYGGVAQMTAILECTSDPPTAVTITSQPWAEGVGSNSVFYNNLNSFSGFKLQSGIAFTAELSEDFYALPGGRIMFDRVLANYGGFYDDINGNFRCPDAGVYVFSVTTHTRDPTTPWSVSRLMMQNEVVMQGPMTYIATEDYDSGSASTTAVIQCTPSFSIYVEAQASYNFRDNSYGADLTSFTGFKLYDITTETVAFTVLLTKNFTASGNEPIPFDEVITNIGNAFDISDSHFVCPDDAYYLFTWSTASPDSVSWLYLYMDDSLVKRLRTTLQTSSESTGTSGSSSQTVILQCQPGSLIQTKSPSAYSFMGGYTSFSGYKLPA